MDIGLVCTVGIAVVGLGVAVEVGFNGLVDGIINERLPSPGTIVVDGTIAADLGDAGVAKEGLGDAVGVEGGDGTIAADLGDAGVAKEGLGDIIGVEGGDGTIAVDLGDADAAKEGLGDAVGVEGGDGTIAADLGDAGVAKEGLGDVVPKEKTSFCLGTTAIGRRGNKALWLSFSLITSSQLRTAVFVLFSGFAGKSEKEFFNSLTKATISSTVLRKILRFNKSGLKTVIELFNLTNCAFA
ncbi:MAG: hypothetical protein WC860_02410 [Candidatus Margulisiibacteriota bacterium]